MKSYQRILWRVVIVLTLILMREGPGVGRASENQHDHAESHSHGSSKFHGDHDRENFYEDHEDHKEHAGDAGGESYRKTKEHEAHEGHEHDQAHQEQSLHLDEEARQMINLETALVQKRRLKARLKVYGKIAKDTENYSSVSSQTEGTVTHIEVQLGQVVDPGDVLLRIRRHDQKVVAVHAPIHGIVFSISVKPGEYVDSLSSLVSIMNVDILRATIDIYEKDLRFVKEGQKVVLFTDAFPNKPFYGKVVYISPQVNEQTQSIKVRVDVDNRAHLLRLGMFVYGELIYTASEEKVLTVPPSAVQELNGQSIVFVVHQDGKLELREVTLGHRNDDYVEIKQGLSVGERVVTRGSFYLKSEKAKAGFGDGHNH